MISTFTILKFLIVPNDCNRILAINVFTKSLLVKNNINKLQYVMLIRKRLPRFRKLLIIVLFSPVIFVNFCKLSTAYLIILNSKLYTIVIVEGNFSISRSFANEIVLNNFFHENLILWYMSRKPLCYPEILKTFFNKKLAI